MLCFHAKIAHKRRFRTEREHADARVGAPGGVLVGAGGDEELGGRDAAAGAVRAAGGYAARAVGEVAIEDGHQRGQVRRCAEPQELLVVFHETFRILLPHDRCEKYPHGVEAEVLGVAELSLDDDWVEVLPYLDAIACVRPAKRRRRGGYGSVWLPASV
jgi:uncharacterized protein YcfJ